MAPPLDLNGADVAALVPKVKGAALQPVAYSPIGAWAVQDDATGTTLDTAACFADRSGNSRPLTRGTVGPAPDLLKGKRSPAGGANARALGRDNGAGGGVEVAFRLVGELTITCRAYWDGSTTVTYPVLVDVSEAYAARANTAALMCYFRLYIHTATGALGGYHQRYNGGSSYSDYPWVSSTVMAKGKWQFLALRRALNGRYTVTCDGASETAPADVLLPNTQAQYGSFNLGQWGAVQMGGASFYAGNDPWAGGFADVMLWDTRLSDAQLDAQRAKMMGL